MADDRKNMNEENEDIEDIEEIETIDLTDEDGVTTTFEILAQFPFEGEDFLAVSNPEDEGDEDLEVLLLQVQDDEDGNEILVVPEEELYDRAFDHFMELVENEDIEFTDGEE